MSRYAIAYVGPPVITSVANVRDTPYLMSSHLSAEPSCQLNPSLSVNDHDEASAFGVPVSVAMSGTSVVPSAGSGEYLYATSALVRVAPNSARSSTVYTRCGS